MKRVIKSQKGAVSVLVIVSIFTFTAVLLGAYLSITTLRKSQLRSDIRIQEIYGKDLNRVDEIYEELTGKEFTITYNLDGGNVETENPATYTYGTSTFTLNNPTKTGYTFIGWTGSNGETPQTTVTIEKGSTADKTYTANWTNDFELNYTQVDFIESTGTQYIDTGIKENECYMYEFEFIPTALKDNWQSYLAGTLDNFTIGSTQNLAGSYLRWRTTEIYNTDNLSTSNKNIVKVMDNTCMVNSTTYSGVNTANSVGTGTNNIMICNNASLSRYSKLRIYSLKLYDQNKVLLRDFVPCIRKSDSKPGLYDKVNGTFYINSGTGEFTIPQ